MRSLIALSAVIVVLSGCATAVDPTEPGSSLVPSETSLTPTSTATVTAPEKVDARAYASLQFAEGVDFDSADGNIHCGIWIEPAMPEWAPQAGCGMDSWDFVFPTVPYIDAEAPGNATVLRGTDAAYVVAHSDAPYAGQDTVNNPNVATLGPGQVIASLGVTCEAIGTAIRCTNDTTGHGFSIARDDYEVF